MGNEQQEAARRDLSVLMREMRGWPPERAAQAVWEWMGAQGFEQAHTPTDDERKVRDFYEKHYSESGWSVEQVDVRVFVPTTRPGNALEIIQQALDSAGLDIRAVPAGFRRTVQGEPTDAIPDDDQIAADKVDAARRAYYKEPRGDWVNQFGPNMRAALRAAYETKGEGR